MLPLTQKMKIDLILTPLLLLVCDEILISIAVTASPARPNFYPFGESEGDQLLAKNDDQSSGSVPISIPFPYFDQYHNSLFVSMEFWPLVIQLFSMDTEVVSFGTTVICKGNLDTYELSGIEQFENLRNMRN